MDDNDENWPTDSHQQEVYGVRNEDFTTLVPTRVSQYVQIRQRQEIEQARPAKPPVSTSTIRHELMHAGISEEDMFKDAVQHRKRREQDYQDEIERNRNLARTKGFDAPKQQAGICIQMCPRWDRLRRANNKSAISTYEVDESGYFGETRAVKSFHRPAAGDVEDLPEDLRTEETLITTLDYLVHNIIGQWSFSHCQNFVWDRTRSIRQDCSIQGLNSDLVIESYERIARFHIFSIQQLSHNESFQRGQEFEQLSKTLISLNELYDDRRRMIKQGLRPWVPETDFEAEFRAYTLVSNLYSPLQLARALQLPRRIIETPIFQIALLLFKYAQRANHDDKNLFGNTARSEVTLNWSAQFFDLIHDISTPYLLACLAAMEFPNIKKGAIKTFERSFPPQKKASNLSFLKELVDASSEQDVKSSVERFGLKTAEENGMLYMDCPRKSQPSTWIANPSTMVPPFPLMIEGKRGQDSSGQFVAARFFIDEPGCYRRVVSQLFDEEVDIKYHDPMKHEPTAGGLDHIMNFASSWESVGSYVYDAAAPQENDYMADGLFDLIQNTRGGNVPAAQAENLITYVRQRKKIVRKDFNQARPTTVAQRPPQTKPQVARSYEGFNQGPGPAAPLHRPPGNVKIQLNPAAATFAFPSQQSVQSVTQGAPAAPAPPIANAFGKPSTAPAFPAPTFGAPASAFGATTAPSQTTSAFGPKIGGDASVAPAFGAKPASFASAFGPKTEAPTSFASAFGPKPVAGDAVSAFRTGTPPPASVFPPATSVFPPAGKSQSVFPQQKPSETIPQAEKPSKVSIFESTPSAPLSIFDKQSESVFGTKPSPATSIFTQPQLPPTQPSGPSSFFGEIPKAFPPSSDSKALETQPSLNSNRPIFAPKQKVESEVPFSIFGNIKPVAPPANQAPGQSLFDLEPPREKITDFHATTVPAKKPPVPSFQSLFQNLSPSPQPPVQATSLFQPSPTTTVAQSEGSVIKNPVENPFTIEQITPKIPQSPAFKSPTEAGGAQQDRNELESAKPPSPAADIPPETDLQLKSPTPPPEIIDIKSVIRPIDPSFIRKLDTSKMSLEPWFPGLDWFNRITGVDVWTLAQHREYLTELAWKKLTLADCKPEGLPRLLSRSPPNLWHLQIVCADEPGTSLDWFMNKFELLVQREGKETYRELHVASSQMAGQNGNIGGIIFGCTATTTTATSKKVDIKEIKLALKRDKKALRRSVTHALDGAPRGKLEVLVLAYHTLGRTRKAELENVTRDLGIEELKTQGNVNFKVLVLEEPKDLDEMHNIVKKFGVRKNGEEEDLLELSPPASQLVVGSPKKRELTIEDLEMKTAGLGLGAEPKRRKYVNPDPYAFGLPPFEKTPIKSPAKTPVQKVQKLQPTPPVQQKQTPTKRKIVEDVLTEKRKKEMKKTETRVSKISKELSSVSSKFEAWSLPAGEDDDFLTPEMRAELDLLQ